MLEKALINSTIDSVILKLKENDRITGEEIEQLQKSFDSQNLVIGVVGKMKAGKSSLVNAVVFADNTLPSGAQPITVTLTEISYAEKDEVEITLLSSDDIRDLKEKAAYTGNDVLMIDKAKNAKYTLEHFSTDYEKIIKGNDKLNVQLTELENFVSAGGKYSGLAKQVSIRIKNENLKGITIIDTPGFNDPIASRGETTCKCLSRCNVILFVHNEDGYDQIDEELLKNQIEYAGISDLVDIFNKVDLLHMSFSEWDDQKEYYLEKRDEYIEKLAKDSNVREVIEKGKAVLTSSLMALCGQIAPDKRSNWIKQSRATYEEEYDEFCNVDEGSSLNDLLIQYSNINAVISEINRIGRSSATFLLEAPLKTLKGKLDAIVDVVKLEIEGCNAKISSYDASIKTANGEIEDIENYSKEILSQIENNPLDSKIQLRINKTFTDLCTQRSLKSSSEFTKENYPEPEILTTGVKKQNVAQFNLCISNFEDIIRDSLNDLLNSLKSIINEYVGELTEMLVKKKISEENRKLFKQGLINELSGRLNAVTVAIASHTIDKAPAGQQMHWSLFKTTFEKTFSDSYFNQLLEEVRQATSRNKGVCDPSIPKYKILKLIDELKTTLALSPEEKENAKKEEQHKVANLTNELQSYKDYSKTITTLLKS